MSPIWPITSESVRVQDYARHGSAPEGAPPETSRAFLSSPAACRVVLAVEDLELAFVGVASIQFVRNPESGETLRVGPSPGTVFPFTSAPLGPDGIQIGATLADTIDNAVALLRTLGYGADRSGEAHMQVRAPGYGPSTDDYVIQGGLYAAEPLDSDKRHFRGGAGTYLPANCRPVEFVAEPGVRVFTLGANEACDSNPAVGGGLTVTWSALDDDV